MKATGIVRRVDDLGRIVIPKEVRRSLRIREGDPLELFIDKDGNITFKKYSPLQTLENYAIDYANSLQNVLNSRVLIADNSKIIAAPYQAKYKYKNITDALYDLTLYKSAKMLDESNMSLLNIYDDDEHKYLSQIIAPIISSGEVIGSVILYSEDSLLKNEDLVAAQIAADFLGKQMEG
jgi:AbrB family transcriptional regulator (stage V sporulation protein T)